MNERPVFERLREKVKPLERSLQKLKKNELRILKKPKMSSASEESTASRVSGHDALYRWPLWCVFVLYHRRHI